MRTTRLILAAAAAAAAFASVPAANAQHTCVQPMPQMRPICTPHCYMHADGSIRCYD